MKGAWKLKQAATAWVCVRASRDALLVRCSVSGDESLPRQPGGRGAWLMLAAHGWKAQKCCGQCRGAVGLLWLADSDCSTRNLARLCAARGQPASAPGKASGLEKKG